MHKIAIAWPKIKASLVNLLIVFVAFLGPKTMNFLYAIGIAIFLDNLMAIYYVVYYDDKQKFLSERMFSGFVLKTLVYLLIITLCVFIGRITNLDIVYIVSAGILFNELKSIDEKFEKIFKFSVFGKIIDLIGKALHISSAKAKSDIINKDTVDKK